MKNFIFLVFIVLFSTSLAAQKDTITNPIIRKNSLEFNIIWPFIPKIYQLKYGRLVASFKNGMRGEVIAIVNYRPWTLSVNEGNKTMFAVAVGYRHYWWKGINSEIAIYPEFVGIRDNVVDGENYSDFYIVPEFYSGYKGYFDKKKRVFFNAQIGLGVIIFPNESYPRLERSGIFFVGNLTIGLSF